MPELPEVETVKRTLAKMLIGKTISDVLVLTHKMVIVGPAKLSNIKKGSVKQSEEFVKVLKGNTVLSLDRRAKYLCIHLSNDLHIVIHLRMSGQLIYVAKKDARKPLRLSLAKTAEPKLLPTIHTHVFFTFTNGDQLFYNDTRQFGHLRLVTTNELNQMWAMIALGPEPLTVSKKDFLSIVRSHPKRRAKDFLLDQQMIAGIGNIYADESLFMAHIHPLRILGTLSDSEVSALDAAIKTVLKNAIAQGGSSIEYFLATNGTAGKFSNEHQVYAKRGIACPDCGEPLTAKKIGGRTSTFCIHCQKLS